jgi:Pyruvate/2-oxoacid:ferredoxin oxidoreductase delta subunit
MQVEDGQAALNAARCIGCGQCAFQCRQNNIEMVPDERTVYLPILKRGEVRVVA